MVTKGRYQTAENEQERWPFAKFSVNDTEGKTLGERFICATDSEKKADQIAGALNFNYKPSEYGYKLVDDE
jgi:hypothetical protein